jgi:ankyrin repeat protein
MAPPSKKKNQQKAAKLTLLEAARAGNVDAIRQHLAAGVCPNAIFTINPNMDNMVGTKETPLGAAAFAGRTGAVTALLEGKADPNLIAGTITGIGGEAVEQFTALGLAAQQGHVRTMEVLMNSGHLVNGPVDDSAITVLHWAVLAEQHAAVRLLLQARADPNSLSVADAEHVYKSSTPLTVAAVRGDVVLLEMLLQGGATNVHTAADVAPGTQECLRDGTPLMYAALGGKDPRLAAALLHANSDPNQLCDGASALHWAAMTGNHDVAQQLIQAGADCSVLCPSERTPLALACMHGYLEVAKRLLPFSDVNTRSDNGSTPLADTCAGYTEQDDFIPRTSGHVTCLEMLLDVKADPNALCHADTTALQRACYFGFTDCARLLIKRGCDSAIASNWGKASDDGIGDGTMSTALDLAEAEGHTELAAELPIMIRVQRKKQRNQARKQRKETRNQKALQAGLLEPEPELEEVDQTELAELESVKEASKQGTEEEGHGSPPVSPVNC